MAKTPSTMLPLQTAAPPFSLTDVVSGQTISLDNFKDKKALLVMFICVHCPYVKHVRSEITKIGCDYRTKDVGIVAICSNDVTQYPEDSPEGMKQMAQELGFSFPFCYDATQEVAKAYHAACTPDFFLFRAKARKRETRPSGRGNLFDQNGKLVYRGQLDDSRPNSGIPVTGRDLRAAIDAVLSEQPVDPNQKSSVGCNIKWKVGNEPDYFARG
ncbi:thioredoxin family protein [Candidatus Curtissbacteria bacterium]|nr:thioredoxin family protein [Candidatus Curtissbacteria bacterium]